MGPLKKPILGGQKPKWAVSPRKVCATVLEFCMSYFDQKMGKFGEIDSADTRAGKFPLVPMGG